MSKNHNGGHQEQPHESCATPALEAAKGAAAGLKNQARDVASTIADKGREVAGTARDKAVAVETRAEEAVATLGGRIKDLAGQVREHTPHEGMLGTAAESVACTLDKSGAYLQEHDFRAMAQDLGGVIRTYPIPSVLLGIGLGFLIGRTIRS